MSERQLAAITLAVSEAVSNAGSTPMSVTRLPVASRSRQRSATGCAVTVCDHGIGMRPRIDSPGFGLGLGLIAHVSDSLELTEIEPGVWVCMTFAID